MQPAGIRGLWNSPAGLSATAVPTGTKLNRDLAIGRLGVGGVPMADAAIVSTAPLLGAYMSEGNNTMVRLEKQLNRPINIGVAFTDHTNPNIAANTFPFDLQWPGPRKLVLSHALIGFGWDMATTAAGAHDADYAQAVTNLVPWKERILSIRIGWEFNVNNSYPWTIGASGGTNQSAANYAACFNRFARMIREQMPGVLIDWCPLSDHTLPDAWYPGDDVVDIIGNDVYCKQAFHANSFAPFLYQTAGLLWQEKFAQTHGKLMSYPEWAIDYTSGAAWISRMAEWMMRPRSAGRVIYQCYWNSDDVVTTALDSKPLNLAAYQAAFAELS